MYGRGGDDIISTEVGNYKVWGNEGADTFETLKGGKGFMRIMDLQPEDKITFCGCAFTRIEQFGKKTSARAHRQRG